MHVIISCFSTGCYYYYTRDWIKKEHLVSYSCKMNNLKEINLLNKLI